MLAPVVLPRMKQRHDFSTDWVDAGEIRAFARIAAQTGEGEIGFLLGPLMLLGDDVIRLKRQDRPLGPQMAVFTAFSGTEAHLAG